MHRYSIHQSRLLDRPWQCGHPFRPHRGRFRRIGMAVIFMLLSVIISGYSYLTDSNRVRQMAEGYLSKLLGGRVEIGKATLSIFEGLRIDNVRVHVDQEPGKPDSLLFSAQAFVINYDPRKLIAGQLEATEIIAQKPHVYLTLTQTPHQDHWNYHRLHQEPELPNRPHDPSARRALPLPQVMLRNAVVEISEVKAGQRCKVGSMYIDGQLTPLGDGQHFNFQIQTRGMSEGLGPYASGTVRVSDGQLNAHLGNVQFGQDIRSMFPAPMRDWWERHELAGRIKSVDVIYEPGRGGPDQKFQVTTMLEGVTLAVHREEWSSREDVDRWQRLQDSVSLLCGPYRVAGFSARKALDEPLGLRSPGAVKDVLSGSSMQPQGRDPNVERRIADAEPHSPVEVMERMVDASPLRLREVTGTFVFTQDGIDVDDLLVRVGAGDPRRPEKSNAFRIQGRMSGYSPDAPLRLSIATGDPEGLYFPAEPKFLDSLPRDVRAFYNDLKPEGTCFITADVSRAVAGAMPQVNGEISIVDANFLFHQFPYPFRSASGKIAFGRDPFSGKDFVTVLNMHGRGMLGGPNERAEVAISGRIGPIGPESPEPGFNLHATGKNICSERELLAAMPPDVRQALKVFDAPGMGQFPQFKGNFVCNIIRPPGAKKRWTFDTDLDLLDAAGRVVGFPYPLQHVHGKIEVRDGYVNVINATIGNGTSNGGVVNGVVRWADSEGRDQPLDMDLKVDLHGMPVDKDLLGALPLEERERIINLGVAGKLDAAGRIFTVVPADWKDHVVPGHKPVDPPVLYDLSLGIRDGTIWPADGLFSVSAVTGKLHLTRDRLDILELHGRRENGQLSATGSLTFTGPRPVMSLHASAENLLLDAPLYGMLPADGKKAWEEVQPGGTVDAEIDYRGPIDKDEPTVIASVAPQVELPPKDEAMRVVLHPRKLSVRLRTVPYPLTFTGGTAKIASGKAVLDKLVGTHGRAELTVSGSGSLGAAPAWKLSLKARNLPADKELRRALPAALLAVLDGIELRGHLGLDVPNLSYKAAADPAADPDIDAGGTVTINGGSMDVGIPLTDVHGKMVFRTASRQGKLESMSGEAAFDSLKLRGRPVRDLRLTLLKPVGQNNLHIDNIRAKVSGGELGGTVLITFPDQGANRYNMNLVVRNADVKELSGAKDQDIRGELTASLALEGTWGESTQRRGRGDVVVAGKQLYQIPVMLGLLQVTNLSLPIGGPFTRGTARYTVDGTRVNFEQMDLRADSMMMTGTGYLDFGTKQVRMTLTTDNPGGFRIPLLHDLWQGARQELLRINVRGTVQSPKVEPTSMGIFTTTIDEVFRGDYAKK